MTPKRIVLASQSPRRHELLWNLGIEFTLFVAEVEEEYPAELPLRMVPSFLAEKKAKSVLPHLQFDQLLITADTVVLFQNRIFGKPADEGEAIEMLQMLSGNMHEVITGVTLATRERITTFSELTRVYFKHLTTEMIEHYVKRFKPFDKAGAYGVQDWIGLAGIEKVSGCFYNVMGLPVSRLVEELRKFGWVHEFEKQDR
ncbi:MAG: Maf family nucleotide pyrophosphatase [Chitinophagales bacterium]|nr:Maf family nucleotide pyrophosphatase [Chitinophagales bacterium]